MPPRPLRFSLVVVSLFLVGGGAHRFMQKQRSFGKAAANHSQSCEADLGTSCFWTSCHASRNAECVKGRCVCDTMRNKCASEGACVQARESDLVFEKIPVRYGWFDGAFHRHTESTIVYVKGRPPAPVVLVHHNYAGLKPFDLQQAAFLARAGYVGFAVDLYNNRTEMNDLEMVTRMAALWANPSYWRGMMKAHLDAAFDHPSVMKGRAGAIGYCLGGTGVLEQVRAGHPIQAAVSFHGVLQRWPSIWQAEHIVSHHTSHALEIVDQLDLRGVLASPPPQCTNNYQKDCKLFVENGMEDALVSSASIRDFEIEMKREGVDYQFHNHPGAEHGFALPDWVPASAYNVEVDRNTTLAMFQLFADVWPDVPQHIPRSNAAGTVLH